jgi:hypothetical protein
VFFKSIKYNYGTGTSVLSRRIDLRLCCKQRGLLCLTIKPDLPDLECVMCVYNRNDEAPAFLFYVWYFSEQVEGISQTRESTTVLQKGVGYIINDVYNHVYQNNV